MKLLIWIKEAIANNPVRVQQWISAMFAVTVFYWPELRDDREVWLQLAGVMLFGGELVRQAVTPVRKLVRPDPLAADVGEVPSGFLIGFLIGGLTVCVYFLVTGRL